MLRWTAEKLSKIEHICHCISYMYIFVNKIVSMSNVLISDNVEEHDDNYAAEESA